MTEDLIEDAELAAKVEVYLAAAMPEKRSLKVKGLKRIHGGASRQTYSIDVLSADGLEGLILRRDPEASLIDTEREVEFAAYQTVHGRDIPVPKPYVLEKSAEPLGAPFFMMERIETGEAANPFQPGVFGEHQSTIGQQVFEYLGRIARIDPAGTPFESVVPKVTPKNAWSVALDYWDNEIQKHMIEPQPIVAAVIRHLRNNPPPPAQKLSIVHGDFRVGNFLHDGEGIITAVLDWEMAHLGDPYEDLAWATDPLWALGDQENAAGLIPWAEAISTWEKASECTFDKDAFAWWSLFSSVKGMGIWITSQHTYLNSANSDPILAWSGWFTKAAHNLILSMRMAELKGVSPS